MPSFSVSADLICAEPEEKPDGEFTGRWISENFATQKVVNAERFIQKCGGSAAGLKESAFFSDSMNDFRCLIMWSVTEERQ